MTSTDPMPWGVHKGKPIGEVPFDYLLKYYKKQWISGEVLTYVQNALSEIEASEYEIAIRLGKKPKKYLIEDYQCVYKIVNKKSSTSAQN